MPEELDSSPPDAFAALVAPQEALAFGAGATIATGAEGLGDLDALMAESLAQASVATQAKAARERLKRGGQSAQEAAEDAARILAWENAHEWGPEANAVLFHNYSCECGTETGVFQGLFLREKHKQNRDSFRWRRVEMALARLPNESAVRMCKVPMCPGCSVGKGWPEEATVWEN
jgi:hypothetical protein